MKGALGKLTKLPVHSYGTLILFLFTILDYGCEYFAIVGNFFNFYPPPPFFFGGGGSMPSFASSQSYDNSKTIRLQYTRLLPKMKRDLNLVDLLYQ